MTWELLIDGIDFGEGPRWRDGRLWYSDFYQQAIYSVGAAGDRRTELEHDGRPSGLGWLPDGRLLFVSMLDRRVMRREHDGHVVEHADLSTIAAGHCNDMVVDERGHAYVGNFGFDFEGGAELVPASLALVRPDGTATAVADDLLFPNGSIVTDDGATLIVGESFGARYTAFTVRDDGTLDDRRVWAEVPEMAPDGCTLDAEGAIWFSDALGGQVVRVREGGEILETISTPAPTFACMLGGDDGSTLFALTSVGADPETAAGSGTGTIIHRRVETGRHPTALP
jgi:sugar lactone lactonase YvrE